MNHEVTRGIVLRRIDYQESDRILTVLTPDKGKISLIAKGARKAKSKLAGGIELFSVSDITFVKGKKDIGTLTSSRLLKHFPRISQDLDRTMLGYEMLKYIDRITEEASEEGFFTLLASSFDGLDCLELNIAVLQLWFFLHLLKETGYVPDLRIDTTDTPLKESENYNFDFDAMRFARHSSGHYKGAHVKLMRLVLSVVEPIKLSKVIIKSDILDPCRNLAKAMVEHNLS